MIKKTILSVAAAAIALPLAFGAAATPAEAGYFKKGRIVVVIGHGSGCYWMKQKARHYEVIGKWGKAEYWWNRYWACKSGYYY